MRTYRCITLVAGALIATGLSVASTIDIELGLLREKSGLCLESLEISKCGTTEFCNDMDRYSDYLFKGSAEAWASYQMKIGAINKANFDASLGSINLHNEALEKMNKLPPCK